jgi:hypothetical protein
MKTSSLKAQIEEPSVTSISDASDRTHHLVDALRTCLANPNATAIGTFARIVESLHAELNLMAPLVDDLANGSGGAPATTSPASMTEDDDAAGADALAEILAAWEAQRSA